MIARDSYEARCLKSVHDMRVISARDGHPHYVKLLGLGFVTRESGPRGMSHWRITERGAATVRAMGL